MEKKEVLGFLAVLFFISILFTQQGSQDWKPLAFVGLIFGLFWWKNK